MDEPGRASVGLIGDSGRPSNHLARERDRLKLLLDINNATVSHLALGELLHAISDSLRSVVPHDVSGIGLYDAESGQLRAHVTEYPEHLPNFARGTPIPMSGTTGGEAFTTGLPVFVDEPDFERFNSDYARKTFEAGFNSGGSIPLIAHGRKLGVLGVASKKKNAFSQDDIELLCQIGTQIAIAVENSLNYEEAREAQRQLALRLDELQLLLDVTNSVTTTLDLQELLHAITICLKRVIKCDGVSLMSYDPESRQLRTFALEPGPGIKPPVEVGESFSIDGTPGAAAVDSGRSVVVTLADLEKMTSPVVRGAMAVGIKSGCVAPLISHGRVRGTLNLVSLEDNHFTREDADLLMQIAGQVAIAVENSLNFEDARQAEQQMARARERSDLLLEINNKIASSLDLRDLFKAISVCLRTVLHHDYADMAFYDPDSDRMHIYAIDRANGIQFGREDVWVPVEGTPPGLAIHSRQTVLRERADLDEFPSPSMKRALKEGINSGCTVPLISRDRVLGVLTVGGTRESAFTSDDAELLAQIGVQVALAVDNALNFERAREAEQQAKSRSERLRLLLRVNNAVVSQLDMQELIRVISDCLRELVQHDVAGIMLHDPEIDKLRILAAYYREMSPIVDDDFVIPLDANAVATAFRSGKPIRQDRLDFELFPSEFTRLSYEAGIRSACHVPLIVEDHKLGVLGVASLRETAFSESDLELLCQSADQIAIAVKNALNFERACTAEQQLQRKLDHLRLLLGVNNAVVSQLDLRELMRVISSYLREVLRHDLVGLSLYDEESKKLRAYAYDFPGKEPFIEEGQLVPLEGSMGGLAFTSGKPVFVNRIGDPRFHADVNKKIREAGFKSGCCVPLIARGRKLGTLGVSSFHEDIFSQDEVELLSQIGNQIAIALDNALAYREIESLKNKLSDERLYLEEEINTVYGFEQLIGSSPALKRILKQVETVAPTDSTVLIQGETGTGKELIARAIHSLSARRERTLVKLNCAAIPTGLLESELFGHERGAFTGAIAQRIGRFELANKGTLFLDEVGEIPQELQPKLLRVLQEKEFERLGSTRTISADARLIAATNRDLEQMVAERRFRDDLFYRLNVFPITIPPLRERREDIPSLVRFFASKFARQMKKRVETIPTEAVAALQQYHWPGNIRELENLIERAVILAQGTQLQIPFTEMKAPAKPAVTVAATAEAAAAPTPAESTSLESIERDHILRVLRETNWVVGGSEGAAARLGLKRTTLQARMKKLGIERH